MANKRVYLLCLGLSCADGRYTNISTSTCDQCDRGTYQPTGIPELCYPCQRGFTTAGSGASGDGDDLCVVPDPDGKTSERFLLKQVLSVHEATLINDCILHVHVHVCTCSQTLNNNICQAASLGFQNTTCIRFNWMS